MKKFILDKLETAENIAEYGLCILEHSETLLIPNLASIYQEGVQAICLAVALST